MDEFDELRTTLLASLSGINLILRILGTFMYLGIIHYERFGEDPQKRTLTNRIIIQICYIAIVHSWTAIPIHDWSIFVGPTSEFFAHLYIIFRGIFYFATFLVLAEIVVIQNLMLFKFSFITSVNEDFWTQMFLIWNLAFAILPQFAMLYINSYPIRQFSFLTGYSGKGNLNFSIECC